MVIVSKPHQEAYKKSNKATKQKTMTSFVTIITVPAAILTHVPIQVIKSLRCHGYFYESVRYGKDIHCLDFLEYVANQEDRQWRIIKPWPPLTVPTLQIEKTTGNRTMVDRNVKLVLKHRDCMDISLTGEPFSNGMCHFCAGIVNANDFRCLIARNSAPNSSASASSINSIVATCGSYSSSSSSNSSSSSSTVTTVIKLPRNESNSQTSGTIRNDYLTDPRKTEKLEQVTAIKERWRLEAVHLRFLYHNLTYE